jgi:membrane protein
MSVASRRERATELAQLWRGRAERIPVIGTMITEWYRIEVVDRSMAIGAQGLLAVLPMLVVLAAFMPHEAAVALYEQVSDTLGLQRQQSEPLGGLMTTGESSVNAGFVGVLIALVSATSFSRALQRMYARAFDLDWTGRRGKLRASSVWLFAWLAFLAFEAWFGSQSDVLPLATAVGVNLALHLGFWWWTLHSLLLGDVSWSDLLPTAAISTVAVVVLARASGLVMPVYAKSMIGQYGSFGLILAMATWMVVMAGALVLAASIGSLITQTPTWRVLAVRAGLPGATPGPRTATEKKSSPDR